MIMKTGYIIVVLPDGSKAVMNAEYEVVNEPKEGEAYPYLLSIRSYPKYKYVCFTKEPAFLEGDDQYQVALQIADEYDQYLHTVFHDIRKNYEGNSPDYARYPEGWKGEIQLIPFVDFRGEKVTVEEMESVVYEGNSYNEVAGVIVSDDSDVF